MKPQSHILLTLLMALLVACGSAEETPVAQVASSPTAPAPSPVTTDTATAASEPEPTQTSQEAAATSTSTPPPTEAPATETPLPAENEEVAAIETTNWLEVEGKTEDGYTYLGNPDAPVTMIDYSDFL
jgi:hypothetical protein